MDEDWARAIASLCGALTVLADNASPNPQRKPRDPMEHGLAYADAWLDNIMPRAGNGDASAIINKVRDQRKKKPQPPAKKA